MVLNVSKDFLTPLQADLLRYLLEKEGEEYTSFQLSFVYYQGDHPTARNGWIHRIGRRLSALARRKLVKKRILRGMALYSVIPVYARRSLEKYRRNIPEDRVNLGLF